MYATNAQVLDYQAQSFFQNLQVSLHIGKKIAEVMQAKGIKPNWLAAKINTSVRNMRDMLKRKELGTEQLLAISHYLGFDFFSLYQKELDIPGQVSEPAVPYNLKMENELLREQLELSNQLIESKNKLIEEYSKKFKNGRKNHETG